MASYFDRFNAALPPKYELVHEIGTGGMGIVFLARDSALDRYVAIKLLRPEIATADAKEGFIAEAQLLAKLVHPNVVPVHDVGESDGFAYYVMDYVQGETLQQRLARKPMSNNEALKVGRDLLDALSAVHALGVIHRDIKPSNIFLRDRTALLADFGIASPSDEHHDAPQTEGRPVGTPGYMPPEQAYGADLSQRTDLYAAAMVIYEAYTTHRWAETIPVGKPDWSGVPWLVRRVLRCALSWKAEDRWNNAREFRHHLWSTRVRKYQMRTALIALGGVVALGIAMRPGPEFTDLAIVPASATERDGIMAAFISTNMELDHRVVPADENIGTPLADRLLQLGAHAMVQVGVTSYGDSLRVHVTVLTKDGTTPFDVVGVDEQEVACNAAFKIQQTFDDRVYGCRLSEKARDAREAYVDGEYAFFVNKFKTALEHYRRAITIDPTFAAAMLKYHRVHAWMMAGEQPPLLDMERAFEVDSSLLHPKDRLAFAALLAPGDAARFVAYEDAIDQYPHDEFLAFIYADAVFHRGPYLGIPLDSGARLLEKVVAIEPDFAPAWQHLSWAWTLLGDSAETAHALERYGQLVQDPEELVDFHRVGQVAFAQRFAPALATQAQENISQDSTFLAQLDTIFRLAPMFDVTDIQIQLLTLLRRFYQQTGVTDPARFGHLAEAEALAAMAQGQIAIAFEKLDEAASLFDTEAAWLENAEWRVLAPILEIPLPPGEGERAATSLDALGGVRALWALGLHASIRGDIATLDRRLTQLLERAAEDTIAQRLAPILQAELHAARGHVDSALGITAPLLAFDSAGHGGDPFVRAVVHRRRARWYRQIGEEDAADASLQWYRHSDNVVFPMREAIAAEVDWAVGTAAAFELGERAFDAGDRPRACTTMRRVRRLWGNADEEYADRVARVEQIIEQACP